MGLVFKDGCGNEMSVEQAIVHGLPNNINYISRDENSELWATKDRPSVKKDSKEIEFLSFPLTDEINDMHSLSAFGHLFTEVTPLSVVELGQKKGEHFE